MLNDWIEYAAKIQTELMIDKCEEETNDLYIELNMYLNNVRLFDIEIADKIENLFLMKTRKDVEFIYMHAIWEGIEMGKEMRQTPCRPQCTEINF